MKTEIKSFIDKKENLEESRIEESIYSSDTPTIYIDFLDREFAPEFKLEAINKYCVKNKYTDVTYYIGDGPYATDILSCMTDKAFNRLIVYSIDDLISIGNIYELMYDVLKSGCSIEVLYFDENRNYTPDEMALLQLIAEQVKN